MEISFRKDQKMKYVCSMCNKQFNWGKDCFWWGSYSDGPIYHVCSKECKKELGKKLKSK